MKKIGKYILLVSAALVIGGFGGMLFDYIFFAQMVNNPKWANNDTVKTMASRYQVIKNTEKIIVENSESIADIASRAATSVVFVEAVNAEGVTSVGNGVVVSSDGVIATTRTVVPTGFDTQYVKYADGKAYTVTEAYTDAYSGIVFLRTDAKDLATISFANSDDAQSGKQLISIMQSRADNGAHFSAGGLVGNIYDFATQSPASDHLQGVLDLDFSETVLQQNIGAPVVDYQGNMIGMISVKKDLPTEEGEYYAIAANDIYHAFESYLRAKNVTEGDAVTQPLLLGIDYEIINAIDAQIKKLSVDRGAIILAPVTYQENVLFNATVAAKSGLRAGDVIIMVNNDEVSPKNNLARLLHKYDRSQSVNLTVLRAGEIITVTIPQM